MFVFPDKTSSSNILVSSMRHYTQNRDKKYVIANRSKFVSFAAMVRDQNEL